MRARAMSAKRRENCYQERLAKFERAKRVFAVNAQLLLEALMLVRKDHYSANVYSDAMLEAHDQRYANVS